MHKKSSLELQLEKALSECDSASQVNDVWERFLTYFETVKDNLQVIHSNKLKEVTGHAD